MRAPAPIPVLPGVPAWATGETLYSWCSRYHSEYGLSVKQTSHDLFGRPHGYLQHVVPSGMTRFDQVTGGRLGTPTDIVRTRTIAAAYLPFMDGIERLRLVEGCADASTLTLGCTGFGTAGWSAAHDLRVCEQCKSRDIRQSGYARWHLTHQLPGVWVCVEHSRPLMTCSSQSIAWKRPDSVRATEIDVADGAPVHCMLRLASIAVAATRLKQTNMTGLATACLSRLLAQGILVGRGRSDERALEAWFGASVLGRWMAPIVGLQPSPPKRWISRLLQYRQASHPLQWLLLWAALSEQETAGQAAASFVVAAQRSDSSEEIKQYPLWPVMRSPNVRHASSAAIRKALVGSASLRQAASKLDPEPVELSRWIVQDPWLLSSWRRRLASERTRSATEALHSFLCKRKTADSRDIRSGCASHVAWLEAHAPATLNAMLRRFEITVASQSELF